MAEKSFRVLRRPKTETLEFKVLMVSENTFDGFRAMTIMDRVGRMFEVVIPASGSIPVPDTGAVIHIEQINLIPRALWDVDQEKSMHIEAVWKLTGAPMKMVRQQWEE